MTLLLRTLTMKSKLNFGSADIKYLTIRELITMNRNRQLVNIYYNLGMIDFNQEIKDALFITQEIEKPGKLPKEIAESYVKDCMTRYYASLTMEEMGHRDHDVRTSMGAKSKTIKALHGNSKAELMRKNRTYR